MAQITPRTLSRVARYLLSADPMMQVSYLLIFADIAQREDVLVRDLVKRTAMSQSAIARAVGILGDTPLRGSKKGLGWVKAMPDPDDSRRQFLNLTDAGRKVMADLEDMGDN